MATLVKSQSVLKLEYQGKYYTRFGHPDVNADDKDRTFHADRVLSMSSQDWKELGKPREVTITIEQGDKLNV